MGLHPGDGGMALSCESIFAPPPHRVAALKPLLAPARSVDANQLYCGRRTKAQKNEGASFLFSVSRRSHNSSAESSQKEASAYLLKPRRRTQPKQHLRMFLGCVKRRISAFTAGVAARCGADSSCGQCNVMWFLLYIISFRPFRRWQNEYLFQDTQSIVGNEKMELYLLDHSRRGELHHVYFWKQSAGIFCHARRTGLYE